MPAPAWPKVLPPLTPAQQQRSDAFMRLWHEELAARPRYGLIERFNHTYPVRHSPPGFRTTLEIGAGLGEHLAYESLTPEQEAHYHCNEFRPNMAAAIRARFPRVQTVVGDCQRRLDFPDGHFDRILAIHVLEHLPDLPACLRELHRLLAPGRGRLLAVIPAEGGLAYALARKVSAERLWRRHFDAPYAEFYRREHLNVPAEVTAELDRLFVLAHRRHFPFPFLPWTHPNLVIGLTLTPRPAR